MPYIKVTVLSKDIIEVKSFDRLNVASGGDHSDIERGTGENNTKNYEQTQRKRRTLVRQLVTCNFDQHSKFITLTFRDNLTDVKKANYIFMKFIQRLKYFNENRAFNYLAVIEFQKRGAVHYHMIADLDFIPSGMLQGIWGQGFIKINDISDVDNVGAYVVKYMSKETDDTRLQGLKAYNASRGLIRPTELCSWRASDVFPVKQLEIDLKEKSPVYAVTYTSEQSGTITYSQYNFNRTPGKSQKVSKSK